MPADGSALFWSPQGFDDFRSLEYIHHQPQHTSALSTSRSGARTLDIARRHNPLKGHLSDVVGGSAVLFDELDMTQITRVIENGRTRMQCPLCPKSVRDKFNLRYHYMSVHSGERPMSCNFCSYKCITKQDLQSHFVCQHSLQLARTEQLPSN